MPASPNSGSLRVRLSHAIGLRSMDSNGYSGPYVKLTLGKETHKSEIVKKSLNPRWDKDYFFRGGFEQLVALPLQVHAWDYDRLSIRNDPLGNGSIDLRQLDLGSCQAVDCSVQLKDEQATPGEVFFTIQWQPDAGAAHVPPPPPPPPPPPAAHVSGAQYAAHVSPLSYGCGSVGYGSTYLNGAYGSSGGSGVVRPLGAVQAKVAQTFDHFDANRSGFLDHSELRSALRHYGLSDLTVEGAQVSAVECRCLPLSAVDYGRSDIGAQVSATDCLLIAC